MTSLHGYTDGSYSYDHLRTKTTVSSARVVFDNTVLHALFTSPECSAFLNVVKGLNRISALLNSPNAEFTVFVPQNNVPSFTSLWDMEQFVSRHIFTNILPLPLLTSSPYLTLRGALDRSSVVASTVGDQTMLNNTSRLLKHLQVGKSVLYLIECPL